MRRLICTFVVRISIKQVFSWHVSKRLMFPGIWLQYVYQLTYSSFGKKKKNTLNFHWSIFLGNLNEIFRLDIHVHVIISSMQYSKHIRKYQTVEDLSSKWDCTWQNQQNDLCAQRRFTSAWAFTQSDQSSLSTWRNLGSLGALWAHSEDSDQTRQMPRLIWVYIGCTGHFAGFVMRRLKLLDYHVDYLNLWLNK